MLLSIDLIKFQNVVSKNGELYAFIEWIDKISEFGIKNWEFFVIEWIDEISDFGIKKLRALCCYRTNRWDFRIWYQKMESFMLLLIESMKFQSVVSKMESFML
jgi:hypothetical protein